MHISSYDMCAWIFSSYLFVPNDHNPSSSLQYKNSSGFQKYITNYLKPVKLIYFLPSF